MIICCFLKFQVPQQNGPSSTPVNGENGEGEMTSKDYYFDSYAHFGIHEVWTQYFCVVL